MDMQPSGREGSFRPVDETDLPWQQQHQHQHHRQRQQRRTEPVSTDEGDSDECLYEEISSCRSGDPRRPSSSSHPQRERGGGIILGGKLDHSASLPRPRRSAAADGPQEVTHPRHHQHHHHHQHHSHSHPHSQPSSRHRTHSTSGSSREREQQQHALRPSTLGHFQQQQQQSGGSAGGVGQQVGDPRLGAVAAGAVGAALESSHHVQTSGFKLTRARSAARFLHTTTTTTTTTHYGQPGYPSSAATIPPAPRVHRSHQGPRSSPGRHHHHHQHSGSGVGAGSFRSHPHSQRGSRYNFSDEAAQEVQEEDEATLRELLLSLQKQVTVMSMNLSSKLDELQRGDRQLETTVALCEIRTQLQELTKSVESCQSEVSEVKRDMVAIKHELDTVQQVKEEIEELRDYVEKLEKNSHRRKLRLLEQGLTFFLSYAILAAVLGMLQFGYNTGVINAPQKEIQDFIKNVYKNRYGEDMTNPFAERLYSIAVSIFAIGGMVGGFSGGIIANRFGRKGGLLLNNVVGILGACLMGSTKILHSYEILFLGRFVIGVNCGLNTSLVPMYISEIAPLNLRGGLGTINQLAVTIGLLVSEVLGIKQFLGTDDGWPVLLGLAICPAILQLLLLPFCPESPRYLLITKQWEEEARKALKKLRASSHVEEDIEEMRAEEQAQQAESTISMTELVCSPTLRAPLVIGVVMQLSQQLSGINVVLYYSTNLFEVAGLSPDRSKSTTIGIGIIMVAMTLVSIPLMDRTGRRSLHLYGLGGMFIFSIFITISLLLKEFFGFVQEMIDWMSYLTVVSILGFVVFFAVGPGSIPWMITAELFSQGPRPAAMSIAVLVNWIANFFVGISYVSMHNVLDNYTFLPFSALLAGFWIFTYRKVPETKNKTFEEILAIFRRGTGRSSLRDSRVYGCVCSWLRRLSRRCSGRYGPHGPSPAAAYSERGQLQQRARRPASLSSSASRSAGEATAPASPAPIAEQQRRLTLGPRDGAGPTQALVGYAYA